MSENKIISFKERAEGIQFKNITTRRKKYHYCSHRDKGLVLDETTRLLQCENCDYSVNAFDWLWTLLKKEEHFVFAHKELYEVEKKIEEKKKELRSLNGKISRRKAKLHNSEVK